MIRWRGGVVALVATVAVVGGCALTEQRREEPPEFSASRLGEPLAYEALRPEEQAAIDRLEPSAPWVTEMPPEPEEEPKGAVGRALDAIGKAGVGVLVVASTLAAAAAPFLLF